MADYEVANAGFSKIQDTLYDTTSIFHGLVSSGILPQGFKVIVGTVSIVGAAGNYPVLDANSDAIVMSAGQTIIYVSGAVTTTLAGGTSAQLGLAATASGAVAGTISSVLTLALINSNGLALKVDATTPIGGGSLVVGATNKYLTVTTLGTHSAGVLKIVMIVV